MKEKEKALIPEDGHEVSLPKLFVFSVLLGTAAAVAGGALAVAIIVAVKALVRVLP